MTGNDLKTKYGVQVKNVVKDFSLGPKNPIEFYEDLFNQTKDLDISIVVNNVGAGTGAKRLSDLEINKILNALALNVFPISFISRLFLPGLLKRSQGGAIINLSSIASIIPAKNHAVYASTKSFDFIISEVLSTDIFLIGKNENVDVLCVTPGYVDTPLTKAIKNKPFQINKYECAESSLKCLSFVNFTSGHWKHLFFNFFIAPIFLRVRK